MNRRVMVCHRQWGAKQRQVVKMHIIAMIKTQLAQGSVNWEDTYCVKIP
jgi:hypothetical protein